MRQLLLFSTSTVHGSGYLEYAIPAIHRFLDGVRDVLFVPWARPGGIDPREYTRRFRDALEPQGLQVTCLHEADDPVAAVAAASSVYVGGGNTFVLLRSLYEAGVVPTLQKRAADGMPYMGSSAGANLAGKSIGTTNDMPIVYPPSFDALGLVAFNINPHYLDPDPESKHMGETRETRIREFHVFNQQPVVGLREGAWIEVSGDRARLCGTTGGLLFLPGGAPLPLAEGHDLSRLL